MTSFRDSLSDIGKVTKRILMVGSATFLSFIWSIMGWYAPYWRRVVWGFTGGGGKEGGSSFSWCWTFGKVL